MSWFIVQLVSACLLPPLNFLLMLAFGMMAVKRYPKFSRFLRISGFSLLWLFSTGYVADGALHWLENKVPVLENKPLQPAQAIVILGGGSYFYPPEYDYQDTVSEGALVRLRYGAKLYRDTHLPVLVTGGTPRGNRISEALQMKTVLEQDFHIPVRWQEGKSENTFENARYSFQLLQKSGIKKIYLVSHAWHLPRATAMFEKAGFTVIPAPTAFTTRYQTDLLTFIPNVRALENSTIFFHELIGLVWYQLKTEGLSKS